MEENLKVKLEVGREYKLGSITKGIYVGFVQEKRIHVFSQTNEDGKIYSFYSNDNIVQERDMILSLNIPPKLISNKYFKEELPKKLEAKGLVGSRLGSLERELGLLNILTKLGEKI